MELEIGTIINNWKIVSLSKRNDKGRLGLECQCQDCGKSQIILRYEFIKSNGTIRCKNCKLNDQYSLIGKEFGKLTVIGIDGKDDHGHLILSCKCSCENPNIIKVTKNDLLRTDDKAIRNCNSCGRQEHLKQLGKLNAERFKLERETKKLKPLLIWER